MASSNTRKTDLTHCILYSIVLEYYNVYDVEGRNAIKRKNTLKSLHLDLILVDKQNKNMY